MQMRTFAASPSGRRRNSPRHPQPSNEAGQQVGRGKAALLLPPLASAGPQVALGSEWGPDVIWWLALEAMRILVVASGACPVGFGLGSGAEFYTLSMCRLFHAKVLTSRSFLVAVICHPWQGHLVTLMAEAGSAGIPGGVSFAAVTGHPDAAQDEQKEGTSISVHAHSLTSRLWEEVEPWPSPVRAAMQW